MNNAQLALVTVLFITILAQAMLPRMRVVLLMSGAALSLALCARLGVATSGAVLSKVPWDVIVILVALGAISELLSSARVFDVLAVRAAQWSRGDPTRVLAVFAVGMYVVSGLVNNITALLLVLPVQLVLLRLLGADQRYIRWALGTLLVCCNLGGAATPIGDFPAILLLSRGSMTFGAYLSLAMPATLIATILVVSVVVLAVRPARAMASDELTRSLTVATVSHLYRRVRVDRAVLVPASLCLLAMLAAWLLAPPSSGLSPELIAWLGGCAALVFAGHRGEAIARRSLQAEAVLSLLSLFVMVGTVRESGVFTLIVRGLFDLSLPATIKLLLFLTITSVLTALFSAGPSMAGLLDVAESLARVLPSSTVYVGLALAVCAGSSLFLTAATSGPLAQAMVESAGLRGSDRAPLRFDFREHLRVGAVGFALTLAVDYGFVALSMARR